MHDGQTETGALTDLASGEEGLENVIQRRRIDAVAGIADFQECERPGPGGARQSVLALVEAYHELAAAAAHGLIRIGAQIDDHLMHQARIAADRQLARLSL